MNLAPDHNAAHFLAVRYLPAARQGWHYLLPGWYVVRTCPCHRGQRVTEPRESEAAALRAKAAMLKVAS
jgi:hypothetical protein